MPKPRPSFHDRAALASALAFTVSLPLACKDLSPDVGALQPSCLVGDASDDATTAGGYGSYLVTGCVDASADAGANTLVPDADVTGNVLVADQLNNRVIILDRLGNLVWHFGNGDSVPGPQSVVAPNDAEFLPNNEVLIVGTGTPAGGGPTCPSDGGACVDDRVIIVDYRTRTIVWSYGGHSGGPGSGSLSAPTAARLVAGSAPGKESILVTDQGNSRIVEVDRSSKRLQPVYPASDAGGCVGMITPQSAERLANGNTLIADQAGNRVLELMPDGCAAWTFSSGLNFPSAASRLPNGNTLIADTNNNRALEVTAAGATAWSYAGGTPVTGAVRLTNGDTLVTEINDDLVVEVDGQEPPHVLYSHGQAGVGGAAPGQLNQPYNAKVVGDYTGISSPPDAGVGAPTDGGR